MGFRVYGREGIREKSLWLYLSVITIQGVVSPLLLAAERPFLRVQMAHYVVIICNVFYSVFPAAAFAYTYFNSDDINIAETAADIRHWKDAAQLQLLTTALAAGRRA